MAWYQISRPCVLGAAILLVAACSSTNVRQAPIVDDRSQPTSSSAAGASPAPTVTKREMVDGNYVVQRGDTLNDIAAAFGRDLRDLQRWNNIADVNKLVVGQVLRMNPPADAAVTTPVTPAGSAQTRPLTASGPAATAVPPPAAVTPAPLVWAWPLTGKIIAKFDENVEGSPSKGIDVAAKEGDPVRAAADGVVFYVGSALRGYGNLVILKHSGDLTSVYAHNRKILVSKDQAVKRGEVVAEAGKTGTSTPRLHFEIRRDGRPLDPQQFLPAR
jgi:lipoprotein NlpD